MSSTDDNYRADAAAGTRNTCDDELSKKMRANARPIY